MNQQEVVLELKNVTLYLKNELKLKNSTNYIINNKSSKKTYI